MDVMTFFCSSLDFGRKFGHLRFFALHLMHNCIYVHLTTRIIGGGKFGYVGLQSG